MRKNLKKRIEEVTKEEINIVPYNPKWPEFFEKEKSFLVSKLPKSIIKRIEHFGSTAIERMDSKPIIDILVEVNSLNKTKKRIVPILENLGYEYFWRPEFDKPPYYAWFIKRNKKGDRTHHIHMAEKDSKLWDRIYFRDYLREFPEEARRYEKLKLFLYKKYSKDRIKYTREKTDYIISVTERAKKYYKSLLQND